MNAEGELLVLDHAIRLLTKGGLHAFGVDALSEASGVAEFEIIRHFRSAEVLLRSALERDAAAIRGTTRGLGLQETMAAVLAQLRMRRTLLERLVTEGAEFQTAFIAPCRGIFTEVTGSDTGAAIVMNALIGMALTNQTHEDATLIRGICDLAALR